MSEVFFSARNRYSFGLYETDGTADGTKRLGTYVDSDHPTIGNIYGTATGAFVVSYAATSSDADIDYFSSDGDRLSRTPFANGSLEETYSDGNLLYFHEYDASDENGDPNHIFVTDGTEAGTKDLMHFTGVGLLDFIFFSADNSTWVSYSDGNTLETTVAKIDGDSVVPQFSFTGVSSAFSYLGLSNEVLFFNTDAKHGMELWSSDIAGGGAHMVKDIDRGTEGSVTGVGDQDHNNLVAWGDEAFFVANDSRHGNELWITDGTAAGTHMVKDIAKGSASGVADIYRSAVVGNEFYFLQIFNTDSGLVGYNIWHSDGTRQGTARVPMTYRGHDIHAIPTALGVLGNTILFEGFRDDDQSDSALYSYNTETGATQLVKDIFHDKDAQTQYDNITDYTPLDGELLFSARSKTGGQEIWATDGTTAGTHQVKDIYTGPGDSDPAHLTLVGEGAAAAQTHADLLL